MIPASSWLTFLIRFPTLVFLTALSGIGLAVLYVGLKISLMHEKPKESDWKAFRKLVPEVRERYLEARLKEFSSVLHSEELNATEKFWEIEEGASEISKILRTCLGGHLRSKMDLFIGVMLRHGLMTQDDLSVFSSELREQMLRRISL